MTDFELKEGLSPLVRTLVGTAATVDVLRAATEVADSTTIIRIDERGFRCVLQISPAAFPDVVYEAGARARDFAKTVGLSLASPMLLPIAEGHFDGRSFAIMPFRASHSANKIGWRLQRPFVARSLLDWLARLAGRADVRNDNVADVDTYRACLLALARHDGVDRATAEAATDALNRLERHEFEPRISPMHGDLWRGNILRAPATFPFSFSVIDWRGSNARGFPIYDLIRVALSFRLTRRQLAHQIARHSEILGCSTVDAHCHLLAALGHYVINRGEMPIQRLNGLVRTCDTVSRAALSMV